MPLDVLPAPDTVLGEPLATPDSSPGAVVPVPRLTAPVSPVKPAVAAAAPPAAPTATPGRPSGSIVQKTQPSAQVAAPAVAPSLTRIAQAQGTPTPPAAPAAGSSPAPKPQPGVPSSAPRKQPQPQAVALAPAARPMPPVTTQFAPLAVPTAGPFTGLLVDARGLNLKRSISPLVLTESGDIVYGRFKSMTPEQLQYAHDTGIVSYLPDPTFALQSRAGARPLVVRGLRVDGANQGNVVISDADGTRVVQEDRKQKFLAKMNVAILK